MQGAERQSKVRAQVHESTTYFRQRPGVTPPPWVPPRGCRFKPTTVAKDEQKRIRALQKKLDKALARHPDQAVALLQELSELEPKVARWPHKLGDMLRKLERKAEAVAAYERAVSLYADYGFLARAIAMAKVLLEVDPTRLDVLERVDPQAARQLHRRRRPNSTRLDGVSEPELANRAERLEPHPSAPDGVMAFAPPKRPSTIDLDLGDLEFADHPGQTEGETEAQAPGAEQLAALPLLPLFAEMPPEALQEVARESELLHCADGELVIQCGEVADALYGIVSGAVRVMPAGAPIGEFVRLVEGDVFGEACLLNREPRKADVVAEGELVALKLSRDTLNRLVRIHPGLADLLLEMMTRRLLTNLMHTSRLFAGLSQDVKRLIARSFEVRRARAGLVLSEPGFVADAIYITLTGHLDVHRADTGQSGVVGAGVMFGQASALSGMPSQVRVQTRENLLLLRLPAAAFARIATGSADVMERVRRLGPIASIAA